jgi:hypothetical protein
MDQKSGFKMIVPEVAILLGSDASKPNISLQISNATDQHNSLLGQLRYHESPFSTATNTVRSLTDTTIASEPFY